MKRSRPSPDEASRIGHILFWLFPDEDEPLDRQGTRAERAAHVPTRKERLGQTLKVLGRASAVPKGGHGLALVIASLILSGLLVPSSCGQVANLRPGESVQLLCLAGAHSPTLQVGDKLVGNSSCKIAAADSEQQNDSKPSAISAAAPADDIRHNVSPAGSSAATEDITKDLSIGLSTTVSEPSGPAPEIGPGTSGSAGGNNFSLVIEKVFTGKSCENKLVPLEALNSGGPSPVSEDLAYTSAEIQQVSTPTPPPSGLSLQHSPLQ
jgi:hypothetical protein